MSEVVEQLNKLDSLLEIIINNSDAQKDNDSHSLVALLDKVLTTYTDRELDKNDELEKYGLKESKMVSKILQTLKAIFMRHPSLLIEEKRYILILKYIFTFFNLMNCPAELVNDAIYNLVDICSTCFTSSYLRYNKLKNLQRDFTLKYLTRLLSEIVKTFTNTDHFNLTIHNKDNDANNLPTTEKYNSLKLENIAKLSISFKILQFLTHPSIHRLFFTQYQNSYILDSIISRCWFCIENIVVNIKFVPENQKIINVIDDLYSSLILTSCNYCYDQVIPQMNRTHLALQSCKNLINSPLLHNFSTLQVVLGQCLLKLALFLKENQGMETFWLNLGISDVSPHYILEIVKNTHSPELKNCLQLLINAKFHSSSNLSLKEYIKPIETFNEPELEALRLRFNVCFLNSKPEINYHLPLMTQDVIDHFDRDLDSLLKIQARSPDMEVIQALNILGDYICYVSDNYDKDTQTCRICDSNISISICIKDNIKVDRPSVSHIPKAKENFTILKHFYTQFSSIGNDNIILSLLITSIKFFKAYRLPPLENEQIIWNFMKLCFESPTREIRLLSVQLFPLVIHAPNDTQNLQDFVFIFSYLTHFNPTPSSNYVFEGIIMTLGNLLIIKPIDRACSSILINLIKFMADSDDMRSVLAVNQIRLVADSKQVSPWQIVEPFIPHVSSFLAMKKDQVLMNTFCLGIELDPVLFIKRTLKYTMPITIDEPVNSYRMEFLCLMSKSTAEELMHNVIEEIVAYLLVQGNNCSTSNIIKVLSFYDSQYKTMKFPDLLKKCKQPVLIFHVLFQYKPVLQEKIKKALELMSHGWGYEGSSDEIIQKLLNESILVVIQIISTILNDQKGSNPFLLKLNAIEAIVCLQRVYYQFDAYLGHVVNTLQTALHVEELQQHTLQCIKDIIDAVDAVNFSLIYDSLVSQLLLLMGTLSEKSKITACAIIRKLSVNESNSLLSLNPSYRMSMGNEMDINFNLYKHFYDDKALIKSFLIRFESDNKWVVLQALDDFTIYLNEFTINHTGKIDHESKANFSVIIKILVSKKINHLNDQQNYDYMIFTKSAKVISMLGNLDFMNSFVSRTGQIYDNVTSFLLVTNLQKQKSSEIDNGTNAFSAHFLEHVLVRSFISSIDPEEQKKLAFAIQEYLVLCDLPNQVWDSFGDLTKNVLEPLKISRYGYKVKTTEVRYPIYSTNKDYGTWLSQLTAIVLKACGALAQEVFNSPHQVLILCSLIPTFDTNVSKFVLPYGVLMLIITGTDNLKNDFHKELITVLNQDLDTVPNEMIKETLEKCMITIFEIIQFLKAWVGQMKEEEETRSHSKSFVKFKKAGISRVEKFIKSIPTILLAERYMQCNMYEGSILFLEQSYRNEEIERGSFFTSLKDMYVQLEDYDQLQGALKTFSTDSLNDKLLQFKYNEDPQISNESMNAIAQYDFDDEFDELSDVVLNNNKSSIELFEVLNRNCEYEQILLNLKNFENKLNGKSKLMNPGWILHGLQASIFTGDYKDLEKWTTLSQELNAIAVPGSDLSIFYEISQGLMSLHQSAIPASYKFIETAIKYIGIAISHADYNIHRKLPDYVALLHCLYDFKQLIKMESSDRKVITLLENRLETSKRNFRSVWKIHSMKSSVFRLHPGPKFHELYKDSLVEGCKILRENKKLPQATRLITKALVLNGNDNENEMEASSTLLMNMEFSKLFWVQGDFETALNNMRQVVDTLDRGNKFFIDANLTYLNWLDVSAEGSSDQILLHYKDLLNMKLPKDEFRVHYQYANYINKLLDAQDVKEADGSLDFRAIQYYFKTAVPNNYVYETLPKAVTLLLSYHEKYLSSKSNADVDAKLISKRINNYQLMKKAATTTIGYLGPKWYIVLSQLIARSTHEDKDIQKIIMDILVELATKYYFILMYPIFAQSQSIDRDRRKFGSEVIQKLQSINTDSLSKKISSCLNLLESIMGVCNNKDRLARGGSTSRDLYKDLGFNYPKNTPNYVLCLPIKFNMDLLYNLSASVKQRAVFYKSFHEKVRILSSMQQPKRIKVTGSFGSSHYLLLKPNDDLRKDNKVMEFATIMNGLLQKNFETQQRNLGIKSFAATPLNETTGIIEWVQHFITLRPILEKQLKRNNIMFKAATLKTTIGDAKESEKLNVYESLLVKYPPVLNQAMIDNSPNVIEWYKARAVYTTSLAVMSIVGYLIGVGDRHLDNIMMNKQTGMVMHIDFDCMFEKGKTLTIPEIVPFRLTPNLVDAMGALRYEGLFRKSCELTMALMRENENILMNFLESFIHDPLMDWKQKSSSRGSKKFQKDHVYKTLRNKIKGVLVKEDDNTGCRDSGGLTVSVSLQVELLLQTATSNENLSKMFYGWMAFL